MLLNLNSDLGACTYTFCLPLVTYACAAEFLTFNFLYHVKIVNTDTVKYWFLIPVLWCPKKPVVKLVLIWNSTIHFLVTRVGPRAFIRLLGSLITSDFPCHYQSCQIHSILRCTRTGCTQNARADQPSIGPAFSSSSMHVSRQVRSGS